MLELFDVTPKEWVFRMYFNPLLKPKSFIWDLKKLFNKPDPKRVVVLDRNNKRRLQMSWKKFGQQTIFDTVCLVEWDEFTKLSNPKVYRF